MVHGKTGKMVSIQMKTLHFLPSVVQAVMVKNLQKCGNPMVLATEAGERPLRRVSHRLHCPVGTGLGLQDLVAEAILEATKMGLQAPGLHLTPTRIQMILW